MRKEKALIFELGSPDAKAFPCRPATFPNKTFADLIPSSLLRKLHLIYPKCPKGSCPPLCGAVAPQFWRDNGFYPSGLVL